MPRPVPEYIDSQEKLADACHALAAASVLCLDTEFHREDTYYPQFALLQVFDGTRCLIIDPLAVSDLSPLWDVLRQESITKVFHAARQDIEIILSEGHTIPAQLFDTQIAASLLGYGLQVGFGNLVQRLLNTSLAKQESFSDWLARPLRPEQIRYAADDVLYLMPIYKRLKQELETAGRLDWLAEEQATICSVDTYAMSPEEMFWRVKGSNKLRPQALAVLRELAAWRERTAQAEDRPRRRILADETLVELARQNGEKNIAFERIRGMRTATVRKYGRDIQVAWHRGTTCPKERWPQRARIPNHSPGTELRREMLSTLVKLRADEERIAANILADKSDLAALASWAARNEEPPAAQCLQGWRRRLVGEDLLRLLRGEICLCINSQTRRAEISTSP